MSVFKGLNRSDVYLTDYDSRKWWSVPGTDLAQLGLKILKGTKKPLFYCSQEEDNHVVFGPVTGTVGVTSSYVTGSYNEGAVYGSVETLYYSGSFLGKYNQVEAQEQEAVEGTGSISGSGFGYSGYLYPQTTLTVSGSRTLPTRSYRDPDDTDLPGHQLNYYDEKPGVIVISIPREVIGDGIQPGTFRIEPDKDVYCYVEDDYIVDPTGSFCDDGYPPGVWTRESDHWVDPYFEDLHIGSITDYEGVVVCSGFNGTWEITTEMRYPTPVHTDNNVVGDIIYSHGQLIFTSEFLQFLFNRWDAEEYAWQSNWPVFTKHFTCKVQDVDYNYTLNPSAPVELQLTPGFTPYITSLGLYNENQELIAVAKLSKPIKKPSDTDMTFDIQIDLG